MKNILACLILAISFIQLNAQTGTTVSVDTRYRIDPRDASLPIHPFFIASLDNGFTNTDKKALLDVTASRILMKANAGDSIIVYNPVYELLPGFSTSLLIIDCKNIPAADFSKPASQIGGQNWLTPHKHEYFRLSNGNVVSKNMKVQPDKEIAYAADTVLVPKGKKFIPLLSYRYLKPGKISLFFVERWNFDFVSGRMNKNVTYYGYFTRTEISTGDFVGYTPTLCIQNPEPTGALAKNVLLKKNVVCDVAVNWSEQMLKNDSNIQRYCGIDAVNYLDNPYGNIPAGERAKFLAGIFNFAMSNPKNVCSVTAGIVDTLHPFSSVEEVKNIFSKTESEQYYDPYSGQDLTINFEVNKSLDDIYAIRFYEDWYYDEKELTIKKVVRGIGFIMMSANQQTGEPFLEDSGIYIRMN